MTFTKAVGIALLSAALLPIAAPAARADSVSWSPCAEDQTAECGTLTLPVDWAKPAGEKFRLAVARRKATDPSRRIGVLLVNPGGPGGLGRSYAIFGGKRFGPEVQARFDIVGWDPRGAGESTQIKCSSDLFYKQVSEYPADAAAFDALVRHNRELRDDCRARSGPIADHADTGSTIQDMDALRQALGEQQINYYGLSYGTLFGEQYAERYGRKIRSMVLDSTMDHSQGVAQFAASAAESSEASFTELVKWCERTTACALHGQDVRKFWADLLADADRGQVRDPEDLSRPLSSRTIIGLTSDAFYGPSFGELATWLKGLRRGTPVTLRAAGGETAVPGPAILCSDWNLSVNDFASYQALAALENARAPQMRGGAIGHRSIAQCIGRAADVKNPQRPLVIRDAPKILMLNSRFDPATPYSWAKSVHEQTADTTVLLTYQGWGHGIYHRNKCTETAVDTYLTTLKTPAPECAAVEPN
ncbi:alpha/beta hydrolase [Amycolatopsis jejuensis]|uniref:alpha/beta hydrolase n=1 Tax=Amycolatopsis jejuensis TaxID=330084 RepID=UPI00068BACAE|nr:alpha/beta hydrolase [Amycolatopsis jejuensis]